MNQSVPYSNNISDLCIRTRMQERLAVFLALIAGYIDAVGLIRWKTYVSFMSGNTTQLGTAFSAYTSEIMITSLTVIGFFFLGIYAGTCLSLWKNIKIRTLPFFIVSGILIFYTIADLFCPFGKVVSVAVIGFAMGLMNTIVTSVGNQNVNTDFVTGTLNSLARNTAMLTMTRDRLKKAEYRANAFHLLLLWIGFLAGAFASPFLLSLSGNLALLFPALLLTVCGLMITDSKL